MWVFLNGKYVKDKDAKVSVFDAGFLYGDGIYDTLRTFNGKAWGVQPHLDRLKKSAKRLRMKLPYSDREILDYIDGLVEKNGFKESRIRITFTRGVKKPTFMIHAVPLKALPKRFYDEGVSVVTMNLVRVAPEVKSTNLLPMVLGNQNKKSADIFEVLLVDDKGFVREGTITNLFVVKNGVLISPESKILLGTTRKLILKLAKKGKIKTVLKDFKKDFLYNADEVFVTNTTKMIVPVRKIDRKKIGKGKPGEITKKLMKLYYEYIEETK